MIFWSLISTTSYSCWIPSVFKYEGSTDTTLAVKNACTQNSKLCRSWQTNSCGTKNIINCTWPTHRGSASHTWWLRVPSRSGPIKRITVSTLRGQIGYCRIRVKRIKKKKQLSKFASKQGSFVYLWFNNYR